LVVATQLLTFGVVAAELRRKVARRTTAAGYVRNEAALRRLWVASHTATRFEAGGLPAYLLLPRRAVNVCC
jgi:hypothetical protein